MEKREGKNEGHGIKEEGRVLEEVHGRIQGKGPMGSGQACHPWEVARLARDLWRLKMLMRDLKDERGTLLEHDEDKFKALVKRHFHWEEEGR